MYWLYDVAVLFFILFCVHDFDQMDCSDAYKHGTFLRGNWYFGDVIFFKQFSDELRKLCKKVQKNSTEISTVYRNGFQPVRRGSLGRASSVIIKVAAVEKKMAIH